MRTFLIATDFSAASRNASIYGLKLAREMQAKVVLLSVFQVPLPAPGSMIVVTPDDMRQIAEDHLQAEAAALAGENIMPFETRCLQGVPATAIAKYAADTGAELIIAGMKGAGKAIRRIFGTTVSDLFRQSNIPVLVIPESIGFTRPESVILATDLAGDTDVHVLDELKSIIGTFHSRLFVVRVVKNRTEEWQEVLNTPETLKLAVRGIESQFEYLVDKDITHALNEFSATHGVQMIALIPHKHSWSEQLFAKSETTDMLFHSRVPLLILPEKKYSDLFNLGKRAVEQW